MTKPSGSECLVCGDKATKLRYSHYGAVSCFSCRAFFRRAIEKGQTFSCTTNDKRGACFIDKRTRRKCAACRFAKCLNVGMKHSPSSIFSNTSNEMPAAAAAAIQKQQEKQEEEDVFDVVSQEAFHAITFVELEKISELTEIERATRIPLGEAMFMKTSEESRFSWNFIKTFVMAALTGQTLEYTAIIWGYTMGIRKLTRFSMCITEFKELKGNEQKILLLHNLDPMFNIKSGFFFQTDSVTGLAEQLERFSIFDISTLTNCVEWIPFRHRIQEMVKVPSVEWHQFFTTPWANSVEHERKYEYLVCLLRDLQLDFNSACLLTIIALFNTEGLNSLCKESVKTIRQFHFKYCRLLFRYLRHTKGQASAKALFSKHLHMLGNLRQMSDIMKNNSIKIVPIPTIEEEMKKNASFNFA